MDGKGLSVLVAEDEESISELVAVVLTEAGHWVETASNGREALEKILCDPTFFDVLITDQEMPELTGLDLVTKLREENIFGVQVFVLSGSVSTEQEKAFKALGVSETFRKPFQPAQVLRALKNQWG